MRVLTVIPTYNERESLPIVMDRLRRAVPDADVLVVDDNSPDGTGRLADELAAADGSVHVLHRAGKESEIDRGEFDDEKSAYWQARFRRFSQSELDRIYSKK